MTAQRRTEARVDHLAPQEAMRQARADLMGGRGQGASPHEVDAASRYRVLQGGVPALHRLAGTKLDAARARGDRDGAIEAVHAMQVSPPVWGARAATGTLSGRWGGTVSRLLPPAAAGLSALAVIRAVRQR